MNPPKSQCPEFMECKKGIITPPSEAISNDKKTNTNFEICYSLALVLNLTIIDIRREKGGWYRFKDNEDNNILIKYVKNINSQVDFSNLVELLENTTRLIIVYLNVDNTNYSYFTINNDIEIKSMYDKIKGYIKINDNKAIFYLKSLGLSYEVENKTLELKIQDLSLTLIRYEAIMERNYLKRLNYLLFVICCTSINNKADDVFAMNYKLPDDIEKKYKSLYQDMERIRERNGCFKNIKEDNEDIIKNYKNNYYKYYQTTILTFKEFNDFWNPKVGRACHYCGISESQINQLDNDNKIETKRFYSRGKTMEVDKKDAFGEYTKDNILLSCYWCNNAKTDEFSLSDFKEIAKGINGVWSNRLNTKINFPDNTYNQPNKKY